MKAPDVNKHFIISCMKSTIRIVSCVCALASDSLDIIAFGFLFAELLGIVEELM